MPLTRDFKETVMADIRRNPDFRNEMLKGALEELLAGELMVAKSLLRDLINATIGFEALAAHVGVPSKSLMRMFGPNGNPQAKNLLAAIAALQEHAGVALSVSVTPAAKHRTRRETRKKPTPSAKHVLYREPSPQSHMEFAEAPVKFRRK